MPSEILSAASCGAWESFDLALDQAFYFSYKTVLLGEAGKNHDFAKEVSERIRHKGLVPCFYLSPDEFSLLPGWENLLERGAHLVIAAHRDFSAAFIDQSQKLAQYLPQISIVLIGRNDWRLKDAFRSVPAFLRSRLFLDFPASLQPGDPFFEPAEVSRLQQELSDFGLGDPIGFHPHFNLERHAHQGLLTSVSRPPFLSDTKPKLSIVTSDPELVNELEKSIVLKAHASEVEIVIPRLAGQKTKAIRSVKGATVSRIWLHVENFTAPSSAIEPILLNWGGRHASAPVLFFPSLSQPNRLEEILESLLLNGGAPDEILRSGHGLAVQADRFKDSGGFNSLYFQSGIGLAEFLHRYLGLHTPRGEYAFLLRTLRKELASTPGAWLGLRLFFHQFGGNNYCYGQLHGGDELSASERVSGERREGWKNQVRYRAEQSKDAYFTLYQASPKVALHGNLRFLMYPLFFLQRHLWRLKAPVHRIKPHLWRFKKIYYWLELLMGKLVSPVLGRLWGILVQPFHYIRLHAWRAKGAYHFLKPHLWRVKKAYYWLELLMGKLVSPVLGRLWGILVQPFHFTRMHAWKAGEVYHLIKGNAWKVKHGYHFAKMHFWRIKQPYYFFISLSFLLSFLLSFPIRKIFYFCEYQYEKRILGLHRQIERGA